MDPLVVTVAAVGAELTLDDQPNLPVTPELLAQDAAECAAAGASIYHLHVRDEWTRPTMAVERFRAARAAIESASDLVVQFTTGGAVTDPPEERLAPLELRPEMATLTTGTVNFGDDVFSNPLPLVTRLYRRMLELEVTPEYEIFDAGMIGTAVKLRRELDARHHAHFDFVLGVPGALPAWDDALPFLVKHLPEGATWSATGIGRWHLPVAEQTIALGGHVRTGFEDVLYYAKGERARSNAQLIERVVDMARRAGRDVAAPSQARDLLGLGGRPAIP
ncbi:MAG TPA: 3-keto-5-aminohexanoate cleavage protein [Actinomycetota bacterium]|nr:3-keto-5-aminohexanoate cleavage protein [Actinomycetota bacterium]